MGYAGKGLDLLYGGSSYVEACRFAKDTMHGLAVAAFVGVGVAEITVDGPKHTAAVLGLLVTSALLEGGAWANEQNIESAQYYSTEGAGS